MANTLVRIKVVSTAVRTYRCLRDERPVGFSYDTGYGYGNIIVIPTHDPKGERNTMDKVFRTLIPFAFQLQGQHIIGPMNGSVTVERVYALASINVGNGHHEGA